MIALRHVLAALVALSLTACSAKVVKVDMDASRLVAAAATDARLQCGYRLGDVVDMRPSGDRAGGLGMRMFNFGNATGVIRESLSGVGFVDDPAKPRVDVHLMRLYMSQVNVTKVPVIVYELRIQGHAPVLIRSQIADMNWNGSEDEAYRGYSRALEHANRKMVGSLNLACG